MNDFVELLDSLKTKPRDKRIAAWREFCSDTWELSPVQKEVIRDELARRHADASNELENEFPDMIGWFREGAWQQSVLDEDLFNQLELLTLSFV